MANSSNEMIGSKMNTTAQIKDYLQGQALVEHYRNLKRSDMVINWESIAQETISLCRELDGLLDMPNYNSAHLLRDLTRPGGGGVIKSIKLKSGIEIDILFTPHLATPRPLRVARTDRNFNATMSQVEDVEVVYTILNILLS